MATISIVDTARRLTGHRQHRQYRRGDQARGGPLGRPKRRVQTMLTVPTKRRLKIDPWKFSSLAAPASSAATSAKRSPRTPVAFNDLLRGHADFVRWGPRVNGDILDPTRAQCGPGAVIHFAALAYVGESMSRPLPYYRVNVPVNVLEAMLRHGTRTPSCSRVRAQLMASPENAPQRSVRGSKLAGKQILWPTPEFWRAHRALNTPTIRRPTPLHAVTNFRP
jgi:hypothetical protein